MTQPEDSRRKQMMVIISSGVVTLVLALIVLFAALSPPSPEGVISGLLDSLAQQDMEAFQEFVVEPTQAELLASGSSSRWGTYWNQGEELFTEYRFGNVNISGDDAEVLVYFGPGLIQEEVFYLRKIDRRWKVLSLGE